MKTTYTTPRAAHLTYQVGTGEKTELRDFQSPEFGGNQLITQAIASSTR